MNENGDDGNDDECDTKGRCQIGKGNGPARQFVDVDDMDQTISTYDLQNGSIINIIPPPKSKSQIKKEMLLSQQESKKKDIKRMSFDPYPDLAKSSHSAAARRSRALSRLPNKRSMSYDQISRLRDHMHTITPQNEGPIKRIYMCHLSAQRFKDNCTIMPTKKQLQKAAAAKKKSGKAKMPEITYGNRCAVLFGSSNTERVDQSKRKSRTSLSTPLYEMKMCKVVKVHAIWEPLGQKGDCNTPYDSTKLWDEEEKAKELEQAIRIAESLGLKMVGWIYSYSDDRHLDNNDSSNSSSNTGNNADDKEAAADSGEGSLPVFGRDLVVGAMGQIHNMELIGREGGDQFITLALDAKTGATEAFQLSDTSVQMVAEGKLASTSNEGVEKNTRFMEAKEPVVIDTKETSTVDSVLCLVNTAMLSHNGQYAGKGAKSSIKKNGVLTVKSKKNILKHIDGDSNDSEKLMASLCDFNILMALNRSLGKEEMDELCLLVKKYARGQRKTTKPSKHLKIVLKNLLGG